MCTHLVWTFTTIISIITTITIIINYTVTATITPVTTPTITVTATITPVNYAVPATARTIAIIAVSGILTTTTSPASRLPPLQPIVTAIRVTTFSTFPR